MPQDGWKSRFKTLLTHTYHFDFSIEFLMTLIAFCQTSRGVLYPELLSEKIQRSYIPPEGLDKDELKIFYNKKMAIWERNYDYVNMPLVLIFSIIYGTQSDRFGRKGLLLLGSASFFIDTIIKILILWKTTDASLYFFYVAGSISGIMGDQTILMTGINAFISDKFKNSHLSIRMVSVSIFFSLGSFVASTIVKILIKYISHITLLWIIECIVIGMIAFIILWIKDCSNPSEEEKLLYQALPMLSKMKNYLIDLYEFLIKRRSRKLKFLLFSSLILILMEKFIFGEEKNLIGIYTRLPPFNWRTEEYSTYKLVRPIVQILGMIIGSILFFKLLHLKDTIIIIFSIISMAICILIIGFSRTSIGIYISLIFGCLHGFLNPLTYAFIAKIVDNNEIGKAYAISGVISKLSDLLQSLILQNIYISTVGT
uniref:Major facilitator superfamily (MFS) profile domain-containing protein n=1 Tax=Strongyloides stercoralis TaxID=6248 RepID=A0AAF5DCJ0_STRER